PVGEVLAVVRLVRGQPLSRVLVGLGAVGGRGDRDQGAVVPKVVGVGLTLGSCPGGGAGVPTLRQRHQVVQVEGAGGVDIGVAVGAVPLTAGQLAARGLLRRDDRFGLQHLIAGI